MNKSNLLNLGGILMNIIQCFPLIEYPVDATWPVLVAVG
jgi:hypothetical protein